MTESREDGDRRASLRVLWVTQDFPPERGGVQTYSAELVRALVGLGYRVEVVAPAADGAAAHDGRFPCAVHRVGLPRDTMPVAASARVLERILRERFDVVFCAQWNTAGAAALARARGWVGALAIAAHGRELLWQPPLARGTYDRARRRVLRRADAVFAVSGFTGGLVGELGVEPQRTWVVPNGTDPAAFDDPAAVARGAALRARHGGPLVLSLARLVPHKGIDVVLQAISTLSEPAGLRYVVVGDGPDRPRLEALARRLGVSDRVIWRARVDDDGRAAWLHACDVFALMSRRRGCDVEGFGIALLEAAACRRPVIAGRSGGVADAVQDGVTGWLCPPEDPVAVARRLEMLLSNRELGRAAGQAGRERLERAFTWRHAARSIAAALERVVEQVTSV